MELGNVRGKGRNLQNNKSNQMKLIRNLKRLIPLLFIVMIASKISLIAQSKTTLTESLTEFDKIQKTLPKGLYLINEKGYENIIQIKTSFTALQEKIKIYETEMSVTKSQLITSNIRNEQLKEDNKVLVEKVESLSKSNVVHKLVTGVSVVVTILILAK